MLDCIELVGTPPPTARSALRPDQCTPATPSSSQQVYVYYVEVTLAAEQDAAERDVAGHQQLRRSRSGGHAHLRDVNDGVIARRHVQQHRSDQSGESPERRLRLRSRTASPRSTSPTEHRAWSREARSLPGTASTSPGPPSAGTGAQGQHRRRGPEASPSAGRARPSDSCSRPATPTTTGAAPSTTPTALSRQFTLSAPLVTWHASNQLDRPVPTSKTGRSTAIRLRARLSRLHRRRAAPTGTSTTIDSIKLPKCPPAVGPEPCTSSRWP